MAKWQNGMSSKMRIKKVDRQRMLKLYVLWHMELEVLDDLNQSFMIERRKEKCEEMIKDIEDHLNVSVKTKRNVSQYLDYLNDLSLKIDTVIRKNYKEINTY